MAGKGLLVLAVAMTFVQDIVLAEHVKTYNEPPVVKGKGYVVHATYHYDSKEQDEKNEKSETVISAEEADAPVVHEGYGYRYYPEYRYGIPGGYGYGPYYRLRNVHEYGPGYGHAYGLGYGHEYGLGHGHGHEYGYGYPIQDYYGYGYPVWGPSIFPY